MDEFTTRELLRALEFRNPMSNFFGRFFPQHNTHLNEILEFDVKKGRRRMAPFVAPRVGGKIMTRDGFTTHMLRTPKIAPERVMTVDDISKRAFGENIYSSTSPEERALKLLADDLNDLEEFVAGRQEWEARTIIVEGKIDVRIPDDGVDVQIDFNFTNEEYLTGGALWTSDTSDPMSDIKRWRRHIIHKTGRAPAMVIMGTAAFEAFRKHKKVREDMDIRHMYFGQIEPRVIDKALTFCGRLTETDLDVYTYDEWFVDDNGEEKPALPENMVLMLPLTIGSMEYGSVTQMENGVYHTYEAELVPKQYHDDKNDIKLLRLTSRPLPRPDDVDSWYVATVAQ